MKPIILFVVIIALLVAAAMALLSHPAFGRLPRGSRLRRIMRSPNYRNGSFQNQHVTPSLTSAAGPLATMWNFLFSRPGNCKPQCPVPVVKSDLRSLGADSCVVVWLGHSTVFIQQEGKRFLIDPVLTSRFPARLMFKPFAGADAFTPSDLPVIDYLIITHDHWDHLDYATVKNLKGRVGNVVCPLGVGEHFERWGYSSDHIVEMDWGESFQDASVTIHCLPSRHFSGRSLRRGKTLWASFMLECAGRCIFISGDGGYDDRFDAIARQFPRIDWAIMENGQYSPNWRYIHTMPDQLVKELATLNPRNVLTVHNSKYALSTHPWKEPMEKIFQSSQSARYRLFTPMIGEVVPLDATFGGTTAWWRNLQ